jgi:hypothetical protein
LEAVATTTPVADSAAPDTQPKPRPDAVTEVAAEAPAAEAPAAKAAPVVEEPKGRAQITCEKGGGRWTTIGDGAGQSCVRKTRDGGKSCKTEDQCDGQCLARSRTCAPFDPLWGCNEVLQGDGRRVTLCLN